MLDTPISNPPPDWWTGTADEWARFTRDTPDRLNPNYGYPAHYRRPERGGLGPQAEGVFEGGRSPLSKMPGGGPGAGEL